MSFIDIIIEPATTKDSLMDPDRAPNRPGVEVLRATAAWFPGHHRS